MVPHMSTLWTPDGERPVGRRPAEAPAAPGSGGADEPVAPSAGAGGPGMEGAEPADEELRAQMSELRDQLAQTPAALIVANHAFGLFELAAVHLSERPPHLEEARLAIDAMAALVEGLKGRLGEHEAQLVDGLAQLRLAFVQINAASQAGTAEGPA
jgi:hypothetical protein